MLSSSEEEAILFVIIPIKAQSTQRSCAQEAKLLSSIGTALLKRKSHQSIMHDYKIVILGPGGVGKSALTVQYVQGIFVEKYDPTIEDSYRKQVKVDGQHCMLEILDTAGTMQFGAMRDLYIKNGRGFALVYSITSRLTFIDLKEHRDHVTKIKDTDDIPMLLVGNKCDLEDERCISKEEGQRLAKEWNIPFMETSAKTLHNVTNIFENLVRQINGEQPHVLRLGTWSQSLSTSKVEKRRVCLVL